MSRRVWLARNVRPKANTPNAISESRDSMEARSTLPPILVIACGALAREIQQLKLMNGWHEMKIQCIDAALHFRPNLIGAKLRTHVEKAQGKYQRIFVAYGECGTQGEIDRIVEEYGLERLPGPHCYSFFAGSDRFDSLAEEEPGTFYLTDFLVRHFQRLVVKTLKLEEHPELLKEFFGNYKRVIYLSQLPSEKLMLAAQDAAKYLGLEFLHVHTGFGELESGLTAQMAT